MRFYLIIISGALMTLGIILGVKRISDSKATFQNDINRVYASNRGSREQPKTSEERTSPLSSLELEDRFQDILVNIGYGMIPENDIEILFKSWFISDFDGAIDAITQIKNERLRMCALLQCLESNRLDAEILSELVNLLFPTDALRHQFFSLSIENLSSGDPSIVWSLLNLPAFEPYRSDGIDSYFRSVGEFSSGWTTGAVLNEVEKLQIQTEIDSGLRKFLSVRRTIAFTDYKRVIEFSKDENVRSDAFGNLTRGLLVKGDVAGYLNCISSLSITNREKTVAFKQLFNNTRGEKLIVLLEDIKGSVLWTPGIDDATVAGSIAENVTLSDAISFARTVDPESPEAPNVYMVISGSALRSNVNDCAKWITSLPPGQARNAAIYPLIDYLKKYEEVASIRQWETLISP